jgi:TRAP-type mannitol/chloroaromatic compound transport system permease small subunit
MRVLKYIDNLSRATGVFSCGLILVVLIVVLYEVLMRYAFNASQIWAYETSQFAFGTLMVIGGAYTLLHQAHVRMDVFYSRMSPRSRAIMDIITFLFFLLFVGLLLWKGWTLGWRSFMWGERSESAWMPPIWPVKLMIPLGALLVLLQGFAFVARDILFLMGKGKAYER